MPAGKQATWDVDPITGVSDIRHLKLFNPLNDWYGQAPTEAGAKAIDQHNQAMSWMQALLQNSARPSGALVLETDLDDENFNRLKTQVEEQYSGASNAGRPMLLEAGLDWKPMGLSPSDMALIETKNSAARDIALAYGVPPQLLGIPGDNTYSNYAEARLAFWEDTVLPLVNYIAAEWSAWFAPVYGDGIVIKPDMEAIPAIADKRLTLWKMADDSDDLTLNEKREMKGLPLLASGGDSVPLKPADLAEIHKLAQAVADGMMPGATASEIIKVGYPTIDDATIAKLIGPSNGFIPPIDFTGGDDGN